MKKSKHVDRLPDKIAKGDNLLIRCKWERRPWCRDEWLRVRIPNGYSYFARTKSVVIIDGENCLALAKCTSDWEQWHSMIQCNFAFDGEGSSDGVYPSDICEAHQDIVNSLIDEIKADDSGEVK